MHKDDLKLKHRMHLQLVKYLHNPVFLSRILKQLKIEVCQYHDETELFLLSYHQKPDFLIFYNLDMREH